MIRSHTLRAEAYEWGSQTRRQWAELIDRGPVGGVALVLPHQRLPHNGTPVACGVVDALPPSAKPPCSAELSHKSGSSHLRRWVGEVCDKGGGDGR